MDQLKLQSTYSISSLLSSIVKAMNSRAVGSESTLVDATLSYYAASISSDHERLNLENFVPN